MRNFTLGLAVPVGHMRTHRLGKGRILRLLYVDAFKRVDVIGTISELVKYFSIIVHASAIARAQHHRKRGIFGMDTVEHLEDSANVSDLEVAADSVLVIGREDLVITLLQSI